MSTPGEQATDTAPKVPVLAGIEELSTDWLAHVLGQRVNDVRSEEMSGEGYNSRLYRLHLVGEEGLPESLVLKLMTTNAAVINVMASDEMFREVHSYKDLSDDIPHILPKVYYSEMDVTAAEVTILMEDIGNLPHHAFHADLDESVAAVKVLARLHAHYWDSDDPRLLPFRPPEFELVPVLEALNNSLAIALEREEVFPYLNDCIRHVITLAPFLVENPPGPGGQVSTLLHGDFHCRNIYLAEGREILFDWQTAQRGNGAQDLAYWMITSVDVEDRPAFEPVLLETYHQQLCDGGGAQIIQQNNCTATTVRRSTCWYPPSFVTNPSWRSSQKRKTPNSDRCWVAWTASQGNSRSETSFESREY